ncbi:hypothetical protein Hdeb2414_s0017g00508581 [Helianthus debilis subsp. tardiflorus]
MFCTHLIILSIMYRFMLPIMFRLSDMFCTHLIMLPIKFSICSDMFCMHLVMFSISS